MSADQRTDAWMQERLGHVTASCLHKVMAKTKTGPGADRANYAAQLVCERLTGERTESFVNAAMIRGTELEPQARAAYEFKTGIDVTEVGFILHPEIEWTGASPDGLAGPDGLVEIKVPNPATHIATLQGAPIDRKYLYQMQWQARCCDRAWIDFVSFCPVLPGPMQLHVQRVQRDDALIAELEAEVVKFLAEVAATVAALETRYLKEPAL